MQGTQGASATTVVLIIQVYLGGSKRLYMSHKVRGFTAEKWNYEHKSRIFQNKWLK